MILVFYIVMILKSLDKDFALESAIIYETDDEKAIEF